MMSSNCIRARVGQTYTDYTGEPGTYTDARQCHGQHAAPPRTRPAGEKVIATSPATIPVAPPMVILRPEQERNLISARSSPRAQSAESAGFAELAAALTVNRFG